MTTLATYVGPKESKRIDAGPKAITFPRNVPIEIPGDLADFLERSGVFQVHRNNGAGHRVHVPREQGGGQRVVVSANAPIAQRHWQRPLRKFAPTDTPVSIVIAVKNGLGLTQQCIATLREHAGCPIEIIVIDNGSTDGSTAWLKAQPDVKLLRHAINIGVAAAWNRGLRKATHDVLMVLNNDIIAHENGIATLVAAATDTGISGQTGGIIPRGRENGIATSDAHFSQYVEGYALTFCRDVWEAVGEFDEGYSVAYCEDSDWCFRARAMGYRWELVPEAITHLGGRTSADMNLTTEHRENAARLLRLHARHGFGYAFHVHRYGAAGDLLMALGAVRSLREKYPCAQIDVTCNAEIQELAEACPDVSRVNPRPLLPSHDGNYYDASYELDGCYERQAAVGHLPHPADSFAIALGVEPKPARLDSGSTRHDVRQAADGRPVILCGLRSRSRPVSNWREARWVEVMRSLPDVLFVVIDTHPRPRFDAGPGNDSAWQAFWDLPNVLDLTGQTGLVEAIDVARQCDGILSVDTGPLHFADVVGKPVVGLIACLPGASRMPRLAPGVALGQDCWPLWAHDAEHACLDAVTPEQVVEALGVIRQ